MILNDEMFKIYPIQWNYLKSEAVLVRYTCFVAFLFIQLTLTITKWACPGNVSGLHFLYILFYLLSLHDVKRHCMKRHE